MKIKSSKYIFLGSFDKEEEKTYFNSKMGSSSYLCILWVCFAILYMRKTIDKNIIEIINFENKKWYKVKI